MTSKTQLRKEQQERELLMPEVKTSYSIADNVKVIIADLIDSGCTKSVILGILKKKTNLNKEQIDLVIADLMPERARSARGESLDDRFNRFCSESVRTEKEMKSYINQIGSANFIRFTPHLLKRGEFFNAIHAKYQS
jgi:hypothetical protein